MSLADWNERQARLISEEEAGLLAPEVIRSEGNPLIFPFFTLLHKGLGQVKSETRSAAG